MFQQHLPFLGKGDLCILDRNFGGFPVFKLFDKKRINFCIRLQAKGNINYIKRFIASGQYDTIIQWEPGRNTKALCKKKYNIDTKPLKIRLIRIDLPNGGIEVLATNILDKKNFTIEDFKWLYHQRWDVEEEIKKLKQRLLLEYFSARKQAGILQDFYSNIILLNLTAIVAAPIHDRIKEQYSNKKHQYQINWSCALFDMEHFGILLFLRQNIDNLIKKMQFSFLMNVEIIRPDRSFIRGRNNHRHPYHLNYKPIV